MENNKYTYLSLETDEINSIQNEDVRKDVSEYIVKVNNQIDANVNWVHDGDRYDYRPSVADDLYKEIAQLVKIIEDGAFDEKLLEGFVSKINDRYEKIKVDGHCRTLSVRLNLSNRMSFSNILKPTEAENEQFRGFLDSYLRSAIDTDMVERDEYFEIRSNLSEYDADQLAEIYINLLDTAEQIVKSNLNSLTIKSDSMKGKIAASFNVSSKLRGPAELRRKKKVVRARSIVSGQDIPNKKGFLKV